MSMSATLTTEIVCALRLGIAQRRQRIGGLAGLRDEEREIALAQRRIAIAEFGGDIDFDRQARELLEPVFGDIAGIAAVPQATMEMRWISLKSNGSFAGSATRSVAISM